MDQSYLGRPERWRGRVRGQFAGWSVFAGAAVAIVLGGLFWTSVWIVLRPAASPDASTSTELVEVADLPEDERDATEDAYDDTFDEDGATAYDDPDAPAWRVATGPVTDGPATDVANVDDPDAPAWRVAAGPAMDDEDESVDSDTEVEAVAEGPLYGPFEFIGPIDESAVADASAPGDAPDDKSVARVQELAARAEDIAARAEGITARAEDITVKAEEFAVRLEGLTARIEELETKLTASAGAGSTRPAAVALPTTVVAAARSAQTQTQTVVTTRAVQAPTGPGTRAPWVVMPQPEPGSSVSAGPLVLETLARGEAPITQIRLVLDGVPMAVALEKRDDKTWRGRASIRVSAGSHTVAVSVTDAQGRVGSYRWQFAAN